ncbi:MAG: hypoxanthine phosphoribosyltransferase [Clostridia bacterium]|nr:hypoxanthine phosphoribosyltransferase [Clostridia bacterium]MBQ7339120.1 hypoxanthine phosphoribosyltransferase [Clostridia bacterium]
MNNFPSCDIERILIDTDELDTIIAGLADRINHDYAPRPGRRTLILSVLKGAVFFTTALMQKLTIPVEMDFVMASSYRSGTVAGELCFKLEPKRDDWQELDVILVEDIVDTGCTLTALKQKMIDLGVASVRIATLLDKPSRRRTNLVADYVGREIPDMFVIGFGLDFAEKYRQLPYIAIPRPEVYRSTLEDSKSE